jgi:hypothetical protein
LYNPITGERLLVTGVDQDFVQLTTVTP